MEFHNTEKFLLLLENKEYKKIKKYKIKKNNNPKISIIAPVYNSEKYLLRFLRSVIDQNFFDIEIIMVDDHSIDNSVGIIEKFKKEEERLLLIKNKNNRGTFVNRNIGVLFSKGKYIILPDPDDTISKNILKLCYKISEKYNFEIIRFNIYVSWIKKLNFYPFLKLLENRQVFQPQLSTYIFYGINELLQIDCCVSNKFYKKEIYTKALSILNKKYLNMYNIFGEDSLMNYILYRIANSYFFLKKIGYYYLKNSESITNNLFSKTELRLKCAFFYLQIILEYSKNIKYEKDMPNFLFTNLMNNLYIKKSLLNIKSEDNIIYFYYLIKKYLECKFINKENKIILGVYKKKYF